MTTANAGHRRRRCRRVLPLLTACLALLMLLGAGGRTVSAMSTSNSTSYTVTRNTDGKLQIVQDAYIPIGSYTDLNLRQPSDLYILDDMMYIADTGNGRALRINLLTGERDIFGDGFFRSPSGIAADEAGRVYVADSGKSEAYRFNQELELEQVFMKPDSPKFGLTSQFKPLKVAPTHDGGVYLVNEGSVAGLVHMDAHGAFLGYFGASAVNMSPLDHLMDMILTDEQMSRFLSRTPPSFSNIVRGPDGLIYSVNRGRSVTVNRHSIGGDNILTNPESPILVDAIDLCLTEQGRIYVVDILGYITEITADGYMVSMFGGPSDKERAGLFTRPTGIGVDSAERIYVMDQEKNNIQVFEPTDSQRMLQTSIHAYERGNYDTSRELLERAIRVNNTSRLAHTYMGKNYIQSGDYDEAAYHFRVADQKGDYSAAFWEIRNRWIQKNLLVVLLIVILLLVLMVWRKSRKKKRARAINKGTYVPTRWEKIRDGNAFLSDMSKIRYAMTHPSDNAYEISVGRTGSYGSATVIFLMTFILLVLLQVGSGFIFSTSLRNYNLLPVAIVYVVAVGLFIVCNFLIVAVLNGKGTFRSIYITTAYAMAPILLIWPFAIALGNVITLDEAFFFRMLVVLALVWAAVCLMTALMQIHEYSLGSAVSTVLLTLFAMFVIIVVVSLLWLVLRQMYYQLREMHLEVTLRD